MNGYIEAICISRKKGIAKKEIICAELVEDFGIKGDAHAGKWHRQVSLLAGESIDRIKKKIPALTHGAFAENIILRGIDFRDIQVGNLIILNEEVILEVTQIGKACHKSCAIKKLTGDCIMPREGLFSRVIKGGKIKCGDSAEVCLEKELVS